jgi:ABC-type glycerol-3-phosphate transport system substrate-binding protein
MMAALPAARAEERLVVWWDKGYYEAENAALKELIDRFERQSGVKVDLQQYPQTEHIKKLQIAIEAQLLPVRRWLAQLLALIFRWLAATLGPRPASANFA